MEEVKKVESTPVNYWLLGGVAVVGFLGGSGVGYYFGQRKNT